MLIVTVHWTAFAQESLTVEQAVQSALETHPAIKEARAAKRAGQERIGAARSGLYPQISTEAAYTRVGPVPELTIPSMGSFKFMPENNYDIHVAARYSLFDFGRTDAAVALMRSRAESAQDAVELTKTTLAVRTIQTFYTILYLQKSLQVQDEQIAALNAHLEINKKRVAAGTATDFDVLTTQVRVATAQNQRIDIKNALEKQKSVFRNLLSLPEGAPVLLNGDFSALPALTSADSLFQHARRRRVELRLALNDVRTAELQYRLSSIGNRPTLLANASFGFKNGYIPDLDKLKENWAAGLRAEVPIFDGGRVAHQKSGAEAALQAEKAHVKDVEQRIRAEIEQAVEDVTSARSRIDNCTIQVQQANEAVTLAKSRYEAGTITNLDLLDVETARSGARLTRIQALYRYTISRIELDRVAGKKLF